MRLIFTGYCALFVQRKRGLAHFSGRLPVLASEHSVFECSLTKMRAEGEPSSDSNTVAAPFFSEGARHSTCSIVPLASRGNMRDAASC
jgi:hypothetical protein